MTHRNVLRKTRHLYFEFVFVNFGFHLSLVTHIHPAFLIPPSVMIKPSITELKTLCFLCLCWNQLNFTVTSTKYYSLMMEKYPGVSSFIFKRGLLLSEGRFSCWGYCPRVPFTVTAFKKLTSLPERPLLPGGRYYQGIVTTGGSLLPGARYYRGTTGSSLLSGIVTTGSRYFRKATLRFRTDLPNPVMYQTRTITMYRCTLALHDNLKIPR